MIRRKFNSRTFVKNGIRILTMETCDWISPSFAKQTDISIFSTAGTRSIFGIYSFSNPFFGWNFSRLFEFSSIYAKIHTLRRRKQNWQFFSFSSDPIKSSDTQIVTFRLPLNVTPILQPMDQGSFIGSTQGNERTTQKKTQTHSFLKQKTHRFRNCSLTWGKNID